MMILHALSSVFFAYVLLHQSLGAPARMSASGLCSRTASKSRTCEDIPYLDCYHGGAMVKVCNWATMQEVHLSCTYNHVAKSCQPARKWDIYVARTPCEVHNDQTTCEQAISPESLYYPSQRTCTWTTVPGKGVESVCRSPLPAFFYLLTTSGMMLRVDPHQKQLQYVREDKSVTSIASDANKMTGMYMAKTNGESGQTLYYLSNIEQETTQPEDLSVTLPSTNSNAGLGENKDGGILTATGNSVFLYNPNNRRNSQDFKERPHGCNNNHQFSGDLVGHPSAVHSNFTVREQHVYMISKGQLVQVPGCKTYSNLQQLTALAFTCNGELYAGTDNSIYRIHINEKHEPDAAEEIITLKGHTIKDFASQPGCKLYNSKRRR